MRMLGMLLVAGLLAGCGVPRETGRAAVREVALLGAVAGDDAAVRAALAGQADAWASMSDAVRQKRAFGVTVGADFVALVDQTAALAQRQRALIEAGEDDPAANRQVVEELRKLWGDVAKYLGE